MSTRRAARWLRAGAATVALTAVVALQAPPAQAGLVGGVVDTTVGVVDGLVEVVTAGWDDGANTPPVPMSTVNEAINANSLWAAGYDGSGIDVAVIDTGMVPVQGLEGKVVNGPDLSFESQSDDLRYYDGYGHGTHMAGIIGGN
ncbi:MAG: S8 family serine peptidase, partial [Acidimicrobiia bacterium]